MMRSVKEENWSNTHFISDITWLQTSFEHFTKCYYIHTLSLKSSFSDQQVCLIYIKIPISWYIYLRSIWINDYKSIEGEPNGELLKTAIRYIDTPGRYIFISDKFGCLNSHDPVDREYIYRPINRDRIGAHYCFKISANFHQLFCSITQSITYRSCLFLRKSDGIKESCLKRLEGFAFSLYRMDLSNPIGQRYLHSSSL